MSNTLSLLHDPRNQFRATYTIERLGNVVGGRDLVFLNLPMKQLKSTAIAMIKVRRFGGCILTLPLADVQSLLRRIFRCGLVQVRSLYGHARSLLTKLSPPSTVRFPFQMVILDFFTVLNVSED